VPTPATPRGRLSMGDLETTYVVPAVPQPTGDSSWATALAMLVNHLKSSSLEPEEIAQIGGYSIYDSPGWDARLDVARAFDLGTSQNAGLDIDEWHHKLRTYGPLWVCPVGGDHAVLVIGMQGDGTLDGTRFMVNDPWSGPATETYDSLSRLLDRIGATSDGCNVVTFHL
ncbi:MAG: papain-like cysteine protease family protein, partial [Acidimicrobiales bacterium]